MTVDVVKKDVTPKVAHYKFRYWVINPNKEGYRMWHSVEATQGGNTMIDATTFPSGTDPAGYFTISLEAYYDTGEVRSLDADATWTSESPYVSPNNIAEFTNPGAFKHDAIIQLAINAGTTPSDTAKIDVDAGTFQTSFTLTHLPK